MSTDLIMVQELGSDKELEKMLEKRQGELEKILDAYNLRGLQRIRGQRKVALDAAMSAFRSKSLPTESDVNRE